LRRLDGLALAATLGAAALLAAGCGTGGLASKKADAANGKQLFQQKCGSCHTLADAGTQGKIGPNLDDAFAGPRAEGFKESSIRNIVHGQILYPVSEPTGVIEANGQEQRPPGMPAKLVTGSDAQDVAAYVASVAGIASVGATTQATTTTASPPLPPAPTPTEATTTPGPPGGGSADLVAQGKQVFEKSGCTSCHTLKDAGASGTVGPNLDQAKPSKELALDRVTNGKGVMPSFSGSLSAAEIEAVAAYVSSVAR